MEVSDEVSKGLNAISKLDNDVFTQLVEATFLILFKKRDESILTKGYFSNVDQLIIKQGVSSISGIILEAGRTNADPIVFKGVISGILTGGKADIFTEKYEEYKNELIELLNQTNFNFPHITGVNWRLDFFVKSQSIEKEDKPIYFLQFQTDEAGPIPLSNDEDRGDDQPSQANQKVEFACSPWELLDMVGKLRDAAKQFERITSN